LPSHDFPVCLPAEQVLAPQVFSAPGSAQAPLPSQVPVHAPLVLALPRQPFSGLVSAACGVQVPALPVTLQLWHSPSHEVPQHTPSAQIPLAHSLAATHGLPLASPLGLPPVPPLAPASPPVPEAPPVPPAPPVLVAPLPPLAELPPPSAALAARGGGAARGVIVGRVEIVAARAADGSGDEQREETGNDVIA
jgi:hypothetical protein